MIFTDAPLRAFSVGTVPASTSTTKLERSAPLLVTDVVLATLDVVLVLVLDGVSDRVDLGLDAAADVALVALDGATVTVVGVAAAGVVAGIDEPDAIDPEPPDPTVVADAEAEADVVDVINSDDASTAVAPTLESGDPPHPAPSSAAAAPIITLLTCRDPMIRCVAPAR